MLHFLWLFWEGPCQLCVRDLLCVCVKFYFVHLCACGERRQTAARTCRWNGSIHKLISSSQWFHNIMFLMSFFIKTNSSDFIPALITSSAFFVLFSRFLQGQIHTHKMECDPEKSPMNHWSPSFHNNACRNTLLGWGRTDMMADLSCVCLSNMEGENCHNSRV